MQEVYPVAAALGLSGGGMSMNLGSGRFPAGTTGHIDGILGTGRYWMRLSDGSRIEVSGRHGLKIGDPVRAALASISRDTHSPNVVRERGAESRGDLSVFLPFLAGDREVSSRLEIFLPEKGKPCKRSRSRVVTFVFDVTTRRLGRIQWGVHLQGREVALQVFAEVQDRPVVRSMVSGVETALQERGFVLSAPTQLLKRAFLVPTGSLNVRG